MPKIFGEVKYDTGLKRAVCLTCNYSWNSDTNTLNYIALGKKITCPMCRFLKGYRVGQEVVENSGLYISDKVLYIPLEKLSERNYLNTDILITCALCNDTFGIKNKDFSNFLDKPECPICHNKNRSRRRIKKPIQKENQPKIRKIEEEKPETTRKITADKVEDKSEEKPKETIVINNSTPKYNKVEQTVLDSIGKVYNKSVIISGLDKDKQEFTIQCIKCGSERHLPLRILVSQEQRNSEMKCIHCTKVTKKKEAEASVEGLIAKYLGRVINGLKIINIYYEDNITKCDVQCMASTKRDIVEGEIREKPGHITKGINLGDIINKHAYCEKCSRLTLAQEGRLFDIIDCEYFKDRNKNKYIGYNSNIRQILCKEVYTTDKSICDYCARKDRCSLDKSLTSKFSYIRSLADSKDNQKAAVNDVMAKYPTIYSSKIKGANELKADLTRGLLVFRDAYRGRDGELYKFCKCCIHGTELVLSESEIDEFDHHQCNEVKNPYMRFFEIEPYYILEKADKGKK